MATKKVSKRVNPEKDAVKESKRPKPGSKTELPNKKHLKPAKKK